MNHKIESVYIEKSTQNETIQLSVVLSDRDDPDTTLTLDTIPKENGGLLAAIIGLYSEIEKTLGICQFKRDVKISDGDNTGSLTIGEMMQMYPDGFAVSRDYTTSGILVETQSLSDIAGGYLDVPYEVVYIVAKK